MLTKQLAAQPGKEKQTTFQRNVVLVIFQKQEYLLELKLCWTISLAKKRFLQIRAQNDYIPIFLLQCALKRNSKLNMWPPNTKNFRSYSPTKW